MVLLASLLAMPVQFLAAKIGIVTVFLLLVVFAGFLYDLLRVGPDARLAVAGLVPALPGPGAVLLAVSIVGATIMPHVVYLHSTLTASRIRCHSDAERARVLRYERWDVISAHVFSQVMFSFGIPFALVPLVLITRSRRIMGAFAVGRRTASARWLITATIIGLNVVLLWQFAV